MKGGREDGGRVEGVIGKGGEGEDGNSGRGGGLGNSIVSNGGGGRATK